jgi:cell division protein FtsL
MKLPAMDWRRLWSALLSLRARLSEPAAQASTHLFSAAEMMRPAIVLFALVLLLVGSALAVVFSAYQYRILFNQHQNLVANWDELQVEWGQLVLEESSWAANNRIEQIASRRLDMLVPEPGMIEIVRHER